MPGGVGTDIVAVGRIAALMRERGAAFTERWVTAQEIDYCAGKAVPSRHFAARYAAKEAVAKALAVSWDGPLAWRSIEIVNDSLGVPSVRLSGAALEAATRPGSARSACRVPLALRRVRHRDRSRGRDKWPGHDDVTGAADGRYDS